MPRMFVPLLGKKVVGSLGVLALCVFVMNGILLAANGFAAGEQPEKGAARLPHLTLALKFVEFIGDDGSIALTREKANALTAQMNQLYGQCGITLRPEEYEAVDPKVYGLNLHLRSMDELDTVRAPFDTPRELVIVNTGSWNHRSMGKANAWTEMPGIAPAGAIIEGPVASDAPLVAHELGHYLNLQHVQDASDLMNPIIYSDSTVLKPWQCQTMRQTALTARRQALRS